MYSPYNSGSLFTSPFLLIFISITLLVSGTANAGFINRPNLVRDFTTQMNSIHTKHGNSRLLSNPTTSYQVEDHAIPDKCGSPRRDSYKSCLSAVVVTSSILAGCVGAAVLYSLCVAAFSPELTAVAVTCGVYTSKFDNCCNHLQDDPLNGWTKKDLWNASLCSSCMTKNDVIKDICNK